MKPATRIATSVVLISLTYLLTQYWVYTYPNYDVGTFLVGVAVPFLGTAVLSGLAKSRVLLFVGLGYFWALVEDAPVYFDSVYTWPEVTRFNPAAPHLLLEAVVHILTFVFFALAVWEVTRGRDVPMKRAIFSLVLSGAAFILAYAQNIPLPQIQALVEPTWYTLDVVEHLASALVLLAALMLASRGAPGADPSSSSERLSH